MLLRGQESPTPRGLPGGALRGPPFAYCPSPQGRAWSGSSPPLGHAVSRALPRTRSRPRRARPDPARTGAGGLRSAAPPGSSRLRTALPRLPAAYPFPAGTCPDRGCQGQGTGSCQPDALAPKPWPGLEEAQSPGERRENWGGPGHGGAAGTHPGPGGPQGPGLVLGLRPAPWPGAVGPGGLGGPRGRTGPARPPPPPSCSLANGWTASAASGRQCCGAGPGWADAASVPAQRRAAGAGPALSASRSSRRP